MVFSEFLTEMGSRSRYNRESAARLVRSIQLDERVTIVPQTPELFESALSLYERRPDKQWSLTDCASFVICEEQGITEALAFDQHYEQAGITALLRSGE